MFVCMNVCNYYVCVCVVRERHWQRETEQRHSKSDREDAQGREHVREMGKRDWEKYQERDGERDLRR
jgi:hypothetical protein